MSELDITAVEAAFEDLALEAGAAIMDIYSSGKLGVVKKADKTPLTLADRAADTIIFEGLSARFPHIPIVTEERVETHSRLLERFFIVDPLDGTREFIKKRDEFTVNIALIEDGRCLAGVVYAPALGRLFLSQDGERAVERNGTDERILHVTKPDMRALRIATSRSHLDSDTELFLHDLSVSQHIKVGSSLKFCLIAAGEVDLYPRFRPTMEWDTAAGHAILMRAGGYVMSTNTRNPLCYGKIGYRNSGFIAGAQEWFNYEEKG